MGETITVTANSAALLLMDLQHTNLASIDDIDGLLLDNVMGRLAHVTHTDTFVAAVKSGWTATPAVRSEKQPSRQRDLCVRQLPPWGLTS